MCAGNARDLPVSRGRALPSNDRRKCELCENCVLFALGEGKINNTTEGVKQETTANRKTEAVYITVRIY